MSFEQKFYEFLSENYGIEKHWEKIEDSYGNIIETFLITDNCAICFLFNPDGILIHVWNVQK